jgi:excisionase family DNA binding protein
MQSLLTTEDVAEWLRMDVVTVRRLVNRGELPAYRVGGEYRFREGDLEVFLEEQRVTVLKEEPAGALQRIFRLNPKELKGDVVLAGTGLLSGRKKQVWGKFTGRATRVLGLAQEEALRRNQDSIKLEHLLLALAMERQGVGARVLAQFGAGLPEIQTVVDARIGAGQQKDVRPTGDTGLNPEVKRALEAAHDEAVQFGHNYIGTEHILLGLARTEDGASLVGTLGIELEGVRREVVKILEQAP